MSRLTSPTGTTLVLADQASAHPFALPRSGTDFDGPFAVTISVNAGDTIIDGPYAVSSSADLGDFVIASFDQSLQGMCCCPYLDDNDQNVMFSFFNGTGSTVNFTANAYICVIQAF